MQVSEEEIEAAKTNNGGWTKEQLEQWGVSWPPKKGWKNKLLEGNKKMRVKLDIMEQEEMAWSAFADILPTCETLGDAQEKAHKLMKERNLEEYVEENTIDETVTEYWNERWSKYI